ncbi:hypothetical protein [Bacillus sp. ISL-46]|uniref:hypothetical protein n=1 Tax=Bacillus sp. ISL-46 TaxID=2819129 RepID=UPI001BE6AFB7|nr:hypothetical protein [Bacillus sp. ISL-46]MBT2721419.1 hypothetical protein [Bacillus sp. ISL-46]
MRVKNEGFLLPDKIVLENLVGPPVLFDIPIYGGIDTATVRLLGFTLKNTPWVMVDIHFDYKTKEFLSVEFGLNGLDILPYNTYELFQRRNEEELQILKQANKILNEHKNLSIYHKAIKSRIKHLFKRESNIKLGNTVKVHINEKFLGEGIISSICDTKEKVEQHFNEDHPSLPKFYREIDYNRKVFIVDFINGGQGGYTFIEII